MAQYKVPQDVEADDKLLGPFSFRQFVYLLIAGGLIALAVALFQLFPLFAIIPLPPVLLLIVLALPLKKDQPMETYLAAIVSYYLKPHTRLWTPGQRESTITITAPKIVEDERARDITGEEATHRLSFLADIVDTEGQAIKGVSPTRVNEQLVAEAQASDMFETNHFDNLENTIVRDENARHEEVIKEMKDEIEKNENLVEGASVIKKSDEEKPEPIKTESDSQREEKPVEKTEEKDETISKNPSIIELANNPDYSIATIAKEADRINKKKEGEVFISLH